MASCNRCRSDEIQPAIRAVLPPPPGPNRWTEWLLTVRAHRYLIADTIPGFRTSQKSKHRRVLPGQLRRARAGTPVGPRQFPPDLRPSPYPRTQPRRPFRPPHASMRSHDHTHTIYAGRPLPGGQWPRDVLSSTRPTLTSAASPCAADSCRVGRLAERRVKGFTLRRLIVRQVRHRPTPGSETLCR